jgi:N-hydroxyarylamine O-acetyltransferase
MAGVDVEAYLDRIGYRGELAPDVDTLEALQRAHMTAVPFENLDVYNGIPVRTDTDWSVAKIVERRRGGWCFELNGAFALLLEAVGFTVARLGAAVLLDGPSQRITHLALEVSLDRPYLVDVGFGDGFCRPLALNRRGPQDGGSGTFELLGGAQGTTLTRYDDGGPAAQFRFKRVSLTMADFEGASQYLQSDGELAWHKRAFATRLLDGGPDRVTLVGNRLKLERGGAVTEADVGDPDWIDTLDHWFGYRVEPRRGQPTAGPPM